jgi:HPt (histidine-containing phosphotransfer) domain-containing protein
VADQSIQPDLTAALERLWQQFLPQIQERVTVLESAGLALSGGGLSDDHREEAKSAAHKLAGVLGTFGLTRGTILAREAEMLCSGDADPATAPHLTEIAIQLRSLIAGRT